MSNTISNNNAGLLTVTTITKLALKVKLNNKQMPGTSYHIKSARKQKETFRKEKPRDIFPEYYIIKVNQFNDLAKDTLDEWIYFLKNSEIKEEFSAKGKISTLPLISP